MANKYSKLSIDKNKITEWIQLWCESKLAGECKITNTENHSRIQYTINNNGDIIKIDFIKCNGGLLTIYPNVGTNVATSTQIADSIYERVKNVLANSPFANGFSILISENDFMTVIELLEIMDGVSKTNYSEQLEKGQAQYYLYQFRSALNETITIKYFLNTGRMQLQGKPLHLFNEVISLVCENGTQLNDVIDAQLRYCNINTQPDDIYDEMKTVLGSDLYGFLTSTLIAIFSTSITLSKIEMELTDYSVIIQQAVRTYEGFAKKIYAQKGIKLKEKQQLGSLYTYDNKDETFKMKEQYAELIDPETEKQLTAIYIFYHDKRHPCMHASDMDANTTIISNRKIADDKLNEIILHMKTTYAILQKQ